MKIELDENSDYWVVRGKTIKEAINKINQYGKKDLVNLIVNNRLNHFISEYADYNEDKESKNHCGSGKRIPYIGWYWRATNFVEREISIGDCGDFIGVMENNKWDNPERLLTKSEADKVVKIVWEAKELSEEGGDVREIEERTKKKLEKLWELFQSFKL